MLTRRDERRDKQTDPILNDLFPFHFLSLSSSRPSPFRFSSSAIHHSCNRPSQAFQPTNTQPSQPRLSLSLGSPNMNFQNSTSNCVAAERKQRFDGTCRNHEKLATRY